MQLTILFQSTRPSFTPSPVIQEMGISPHLINVFSLSSLIQTINRAIERHKVSKVSLVVFMYPQKVSPHDMAQQEEEVARFNQLLAGCAYPTRLINPVLRQIEGGPGIFAHKSSQDFIYLVEGDCLHDETALTEMLHEYEFLSENSKQDILVTPFDHLELYKGPHPSQVIAGSHRYWRTIPHCSRSLLMHHKTFARFAEVFEYDSRRFDGDRQKEGNDLIPILRLIPCYAPMPALAESLKAVEKSPFTHQIFAHWSSQAGAIIKNKTSINQDNVNL